MKVNHLDCSTALKFQWTCISNDLSSQSGRSNKDSRYASSNNRSREICPRSRFHHAACSLGKYVYIFGGKDRYSPLKDLWRFDTAIQEWEQVEDIKSKIPHLQGHTMLTYKSQIVIFGGTFSETSEDMPLWIYNTDLNHVHKFSCEPYTIRPVGRREHSAVIYKNCMYIYGGFLDSSGSTDEFWAFSIEEEDWRVIRRHKPGKRHGHVAVVAENKMWLHGGMSGLTALSDLWTFSFGTNTWHKVKGLGASPALSNHTGHVVDKSLILFGGTKSGIFSQDIWIFRIDALTWRHVSTQNGDVCPPITLHTSVLLSSSLVQNTTRDHSQSVPQLKGKSIINSELRPWTSPTVNSSDSEQSLPRSATSNVVDILRLDMLRIDGNNNNSQEDIHHRSEPKKTEAETSFCSIKHIQTSDGSSLEQKNVGNKTSLIDPSCPHHGLPSQPDQATRHHSETGKIRSASAENCGDAIPLLSRFCSVTSEDLGENNLTLTLSDEDIYRQGFLEHNASIQLNKNNPSAEVNEYGSDDFEKCLSNVHLKNILSENEFITEGKVFEPSSFFSMEKDREFLKFKLPQNLETEGTKKSVNLELASVNDISEISSKKITANSSIHFESAVQEDTNIVSSDSRNIFKPCATVVTSHYNDYEHVRGRNRNMQPESKCASDLKVEDLELCDISEFFHNIKISCPSKPYLRSSSLKDLCVNDLYDVVKSNFMISELSKSQLTRSCGNISSLENNEMCVTRFKSHKLFIEKQNIKNSSSQMQFKKENSCFKSETISGKYVKSVNSSTGKIPFLLSKSRSNLYKLQYSEKISVGTQTIGSQMSLSDHKPHLTLVDRSSRLNHFVTQDPADSGAHKYEVAQSAEKQADSATTKNSIFSDAKLCFLVIGGQTENHSCNTEPLKMWRCCLY